MPRVCGTMLMKRLGNAARVQKEPAHLASHRPFKTRAAVSGSCECAAASASTSQKQHMRGVCMGRAECRGHVHTRCDAYGEPKRHARTRASSVRDLRHPCGQSTAAPLWPKQRCQIRAKSLSLYNARKMLRRVKLHMECVCPIGGCLRALCRPTRGRCHCWF